MAYYGQQNQPPRGYNPTPAYGTGAGYRNQAPGYGTPSTTAYATGPAGYPGPAGYSTPRPTGGYAPSYAPTPPPGISPELWNWFQSVDDDRNGRITADELQKALLNGNWTPFNGETCRLMIGMFDVDHNGTIDINEFGALWKYIQDWKKCFDSFDTDRSGNIDVNELSRAFQTFGYRLSPSFCQLCIQMYDRRSQRSINFDDFIQCCVTLKVLTDKFKEKDVQQQGTIRIHYEEFLKMVLDNTLVIK